MPQIQDFHDFIFEDDLPIKFHGYHTYLIYHVVAACNIAKDLAKDVTIDSIFSIPGTENILSMILLTTSSDV